MTGIARFEDLEAWKSARELTKAINIRLLQLVTLHVISASGIRSGVLLSIMSNIAEGFERKGDKEFKYFLSLAKRSTGEVKAQLYVALDARFISEAQFGPIV